MRIIILGLLLAGVVALACGDNGESSDDRGAIHGDRVIASRLAHGFPS